MECGSLCPNAADGQAENLPVRLITNGSLLDRKYVQAGIARIGRSGGEVWFKVDSATGPGLAAQARSEVRIAVPSPTGRSSSIG